MDLVAEGVIFFITGFETISAAMSFTLYELAKHPEIQDHLVKEIKDEDAKNEAFRLWPPVVTLDRVCVKNYNMGRPNEKIRKGAILSLPVWCFHRDPKLFPNPEKFDPERFQKKTSIISISWLICHLGWDLEIILMIFLIWSVVVIAVLALYFRQKYSVFSNYGVRHLEVVPFLGNMTRMVFRNAHFAELLDILYSRFSGERFVGRYEFMKPVVVIHDLDLVKRITIKDFEHFLDHREFNDETVEPIFARNLFSLKGQEWKDMRSTLSPAFTSSKIKLMVPFMEEVGQQMIRALKKKIKESDTGYVDIDTKDLTRRFANDVIASCAFGLKIDSHGDEKNQFYEIGKTLSTFRFKQMIMFFLISALPGLAKKLKLKFFSDTVKNFFCNLVLNTMSDREIRNIIRPDMIHLLMEAKKGQLRHEKSSADTTQDTGFATVEESSVDQITVNRTWSDMDLIAQAVLFFIAGFETISAAMSFTLHELAMHPEIQERLVKEIKDEDAKNGGKITFNAIQNMSYMDMVTSEALRFWPPVLALDRVCVKDYNLGRPNDKASKDYIIRKGELLSIPAWCFHRDPELFPNPNKFDPERFSEENKHNINPMAYMPFGIGPRNCIGSRFALCELKVLLYHILLYMEVSPSHKTCIPAKLSPTTFNIVLVGGHWLKFKIRD